MTVAPPAPYRRSPPPPAARRNTSAMPARDRRPSFDRCERLASADRRHQKPPPSPLPTKTPGADGCRRRARPPSATLKSPWPHSPNGPLPPRGFLLGRLSGAGPDARPTVAKAGARNPSPFLPFGQQPLSPTATYPDGKQVLRLAARPRRALPLPLSLSLPPGRGALLPRRGRLPRACRLGFGPVLSPLAPSLWPLLLDLGLARPSDGSHEARRGPGLGSPFDPGSGRRFPRLRMYDNVLYHRVQTSL